MCAACILGVHFASNKRFYRTRHEGDHACYACYGRMLPWHHSIRCALGGGCPWPFILLPSPTAGGAVVPVVPMACFRAAAAAAATFRYPLLAPPLLLPTALTVFTALRWMHCWPTQTMQSGTGAWPPRPLPSPASVRADLASTETKG